MALRKKYLIISILILALITVGYSSVTTLAVNMESEQDKVNLNYQQTKIEDSPSMFSIILQLILALGIIILLAWSAIQLVSKMGVSRFQGRWIKVLDEVVIGQNRGVVILEVGGRALVVAFTDHNVALLTEIDDQELIQEMVAVGFESPKNPTGLAFLRDKLTGFWPFHRDKSIPEFNTMVSDKVRAMERMSGRLKAIDELLRKGDHNE